MKAPILFFSTAALLFSTFNSCKKDESKPAQTVFGTAVGLGNDSIRPFVSLAGNGQPQTIGVQFGENALSGLPTDTMPGMPDYQYILNLPDEAKTTGIDHIEVDWNPFGHDPFAIYGVPHFDFHFYYVSQEDLATIVPGPDTTPVAPQFIPQDYTSSIDAVPNMGVHWFDSTAAEFHGTPFTATFIYGFYKGNFMFQEPMITKAYLDTHPDLSAVIKQPQAFQKSAYYATGFGVKYDAAKQQYTVALSGLTKH